MALTAQELATNSRCIDCIPVGLRDAVIIYLLNQLANVATPQQLVDAARCYDCIPVGLRSAVITYLQDAILSGGGSGGVQVFYLEPGDDPNVLGLVPASNAGVAYNLAGDVYTYEGFGGPWHQIIAA